jgi:DNA polymerase-3 subunit delta'
MNEDIPHPRETFDFLSEAVEDAFQSAMDRGRLHHAWLLGGPEGIGKATFAYRVARRLLGAAPEPALGTLGSRPDDPVCRQVAARAHPDLIVIQRDPEDGKTRKGIPVEEARGLPEFFAKSPASAPFRVAIVDAADDLNRFGANAVLKILEEPPQRGVLLLVANAPGRLFPTLRSRCRRLNFDAPPGPAALAWLTVKAQIDEAHAERLLSLAAGAPGRAWRLAAAGAAEIDRAAGEILRALPGTDAAAMLALADGFRGPTGAIKFNLLFERLAAQIRTMATERALAVNPGDDASGDLDRWARAWELIVRLPREVEALNLDRGDAFYTALAELRAIG